MDQCVVSAGHYVKVYNMYMYTCRLGKLGAIELYST